MAEQFQGTTITFQSGFCAEITGVSHSGIARTAIDTTHTTSTDGWMTFTPSDLKNNGELKVDLQFDSGEEPPIDAAAETITVSFASGATMACTGFMTAFEYTGQMDDKWTASATLKLSGEWTWTAA